jgi:hypothetical protein
MAGDMTLGKFMRRPIHAFVLALTILTCDVARSAEPRGSAPLASLEKFVSADFCAAIVVHPSRMANGDVLKQIPLDSLLAAGLSRLTDSPKLKQLMQVENVRRVTIFIEPFPGGNVAFFPAAAIEFNSDADGKAVLQEVWKDLREVSFHGHTYLSTKAGMAGAPTAALVSDKRTVLVAPEGTLNKMLDANKENALMKQLRQSDLDHDVVLEYSGDALADRITRVFNVPIERLLEDPHTDVASKMLVRDVKSVSLSLDFNGGQLLRGKVATPSTEAADRILKTIASARETFAAKYSQNGAAALAQIPPPLREPLDDTLKQALHDFGVKASENSVSLSLPTPKSWPDLVRAAADLLVNSANAPK